MAARRRLVVPPWTGWYRHVTLAMLALAYLAVVRAGAPSSGGRGYRDQAHGRTGPRAPAGHRARSAPPGLPARLAIPAAPRAHPSLVGLAPTAPTTSQAQPLQAANGATAAALVGNLMPDCAVSGR
jgi:hypothetical protein